MTLFLRDPRISFGNDVVDLQEETDRSTSFLQRYVRHICTDAEAGLVSAEPDLAFALWKLWALKESAYKAVNRRDRSRAFRYRELEVQPGFRRVKDRWTGNSFDAFVQATPEFVFGVAWTDDRTEASDKSADPEPLLVSWIDRVPSVADLSRAVRLQVERVLGRLEHEYNEEPIKRTADQEGILSPPVLDLPRGPAPVSLSHHGRLVMTTMLLDPSAEGAVSRAFESHRHLVVGRRIFFLSV